MILNQEQIRRMTNGGSSVVVGGGSGAGSGDGITMAWVDANYVSKEFFSRLFKAYDSAATPNEVLPNDLESTITNIKLMFGTWTEQYLSALGQSAGGSSGASALVDLTDVAISSPTDGQVLTYDANLGKWVNRAAGGGGATALSGLSDVQLSTPSDGNVLAYDSTAGKWINNANFIMKTGNTSLSGTFSPSFNEGANLGSSSNRFDYVYATNGVFSSSLKLGGKDVATQYWVGQQGFLTSETYTGTVTSVGLSMPTGFSVSGFPVTSSGTLAVSFGGTITKNRVLASPNGSNGSPSWRALVAADIPDLSGTYLTSSAISDMATKTWVGQQGYLTSVDFSDLTSHPTTLSGYGITDAMLTEILSSTSNIDTLYAAGSYRFSDTAQGTWPTGVTANYGQMLVIRGGSDTVAQMFFPYSDTQAYLRVGNPMNANNGSWKSWKELATTDGNIASATKLQTARTLWGQLFDGTANVSGDMSSVGSITMSGSITMNNNTAIRMKDNSDNTVSLLHMDTGGNFVIGETVDIYSHNTYIRGANIIFQQGVTSAGRKELMRISPDSVKFYIGQTTEVASVYKDNSRQGLRIGNAFLSWDSSNNALKLSKIDGQGNEVAANLYALGGVSALGFTAPQSNLDAFHIDYLTSTNVSTQTIDVATKINLGSSNCYIQAGSGGSLSINASSGLTLGNSNVFSDSMGGLHASKFYLDSSRYLYVSSGTLYYYNGTTSKQVMLS